MADFFDSETGENVATHNEFLRRKVFYIHGTTSEPKRWTDWKEAVEVLNKIALPAPVDAVDTAFNWKEEAGQFNNLKDRWPVSDRLVQYVKENALNNNYTEVVLVGHSHGGNVAIMAADKLAKESGLLNVYVITVGTPVFNKTTFSTLSLINGLKQAAETKVTYKDIAPYMNAPYRQTLTTYTYTYFNPENPVNWENKHKIKHLSIYNEYDRVDGIALAGSIILENSRMTLNTSRFAYNQSINKGLKSKLVESEINRTRYCNYCSLVIEIILKLKQMILDVEMPLKITYGSSARSEGQDNVYIQRFARDIEFLGYRKISVPLPKFRQISLNQYLSGRLPNFDKLDIQGLKMIDARLLFAEDWAYSNFSSAMDAASKTEPVKEFPYPVDGMDFMSPNIKLIDDQLDVLAQEIVRMIDFNNRTNKDKIENVKWWAGVVHYGSKQIFKSTPRPIRYLFEGINDHGFDINSPELIQQEIDNENIKPFLWVRNTKTDE